jgi:hypothetical protein
MMNLARSTSKCAKTSQKKKVKKRFEVKEHSLKPSPNAVQLFCAIAWQQKKKVQKK